MALEPGAKMMAMSARTVIAVALLASCARHPQTPMTPNTPGAAAADAAAHAPSARIPSLDEAAAEVLQTGKYETATFALG